MDQDRPRPAAQYVRMSTDHQRYSIAHQAAANAAYAQARGYEIVRTYADPGASGLSIRRREGLRRLLTDVMAPDRGFELVLVYDVSRWGRFQDTDEAAHYEFLCRQAGVRVEYVAEPFENDGSLASTLIKQLKRAMAAEYSRDLSDRISRVKQSLRREGYWTGGPPGFGYRRMAVVPGADAARPLREGDPKARHERIRLVLGPDHEVETVRRVFRLFAITGLSVSAIADLLNREGVRAEAGAAWSPHRVRALLRNQRYIGVLEGGKQVDRLRRRTTIPRAQWERMPGAAPRIVSDELFQQTARSLRKRRPKVSDEALIEALKVVLARHGRLSRALIDAADETHSAPVYIARFGGLTPAYLRAGYTPSPRQARCAEVARRRRPDLCRIRPPPPSEATLLAALRRLLAREGRLSVELINAAADVPAAEVYRRRFGGMRRAYALAGYAPSELQERIMDARPSQTLDRAAAAELRVAALTQGPGPGLG